MLSIDIILTEFHLHSSTVRHVQFFPDVNRILTSGYDHIYFITDFETQKQVFKYPDNRPLTFCDIGNRLIAGNGSPGLVFIDSRTGKSRKTTGPEYLWAQVVNGDLMFGGDTSGQVKAFRLKPPKHCTHAAS